MKSFGIENTINITKEKVGEKNHPNTKHYLVAITYWISDILYSLYSYAFEYILEITN